MRAFAREVSAVWRLDLAEVLRSRWLVFACAVYGVLTAVFVLVGFREAALLGFTGMGRVVLALSHALILLLPLLALAATSQVVNRCRDDGTFELLFTQPLRRSAWFVGVSTMRLMVLAAPLVLLFVGLSLYGQWGRGEEVPWGFVARALGVSVALLVCFVGIGLFISTAVRHAGKAAVYVLFVWALAVALMDFGLIGLMLKWRLDAKAVFVLATLNPVQDARLALLSGLEPDLATLGPVGFYLATRYGSGMLLALGIGVPCGVGAAAWGAAFLKFRRGDLV